MMVVHRPWRGERQENHGIAGKRVLIVGYSHYVKARADLARDDITHEVISNVINPHHPEGQKGFWVAIRNWFKFEQHEDFWPRVGFINYDPGPIGTQDDAFRKATDVELVGAADRLLSVMADQNADVAFVFTVKGGTSLKQQLAKYEPSLSKLILAKQDGLRAEYTFEEVRLAIDGRRYRIILSRHPQGAHRKTMTAMVDTVLGIEAA